MDTAYHSLTFELPEASSEILQALLHDFGALGLEIRDSEAPPMPGVRGPNPGEAIVVAFFQDATAAQEALDHAREEFPQARYQLDSVQTQDWSQSWRAQIRSVEVGRLWVGPPWEKAKAPVGKLCIEIEPKMAFGTGDHPTTMLCLEALDASMTEHPGATVLDVGTGTGILAIAARKLGAGRVVGIDNDPMSVTLAQENAALNHAEPLELSGGTLDDVGGPYDIVMANILANTLIDMAPALAPKVRHRLVLAGVLVHQKDEVVAAYQRAGMALESTQSIGEWIRLSLRPAHDSRSSSRSG